MEDNLKILILNRSDCPSLIAFDGKVTGRFVPDIELDLPTLKIDWTDPELAADFANENNDDDYTLITTCR